MYLTSKLSKFEITDWLNKKENSKQKWWEQFVDGLNVEILEDVCHQVLDLYAHQQHQSPGQQQQQSQQTNNDHQQKIPVNNKRVRIFYLSRLKHVSNRSFSWLLSNLRVYRLTNHHHTTLVQLSISNRPKVSGNRAHMYHIQIIFLL
jgi:hypothetical protein